MEKSLLKIELPKACECGCKYFVFKGVQEGIDYDLNLFNCLECGTTISTPKEKEEAA